MIPKDVLYNFFNIRFGEQICSTTNYLTYPFRYLGEAYNGKLAGKRVLELGCGAGLPGIYCFTQGASGKFKVVSWTVLSTGTVVPYLYRFIQVT
jgi:hypothetical protein